MDATPPLPAAFDAQRPPTYIPKMNGASRRRYGSPASPFVICLLLIALAAGSAAAQSGSGASQRAPTILDDLDEVLRILEEGYVDEDLPVDVQALDRDYRSRISRASNPVEAYELLNQLVAELQDPNTFIIPAALRSAAEQAAAAEGEPEVEYAGIGVMIQPVQPSGVLVVNVFEGSPAEAAGLLVGDVIMGVDDWDATGGEQTQDFVERIRGPIGTPVLLTVTSPYGAERTVEVLRGKIDLRPAVTHRTVGNRTAYLRLPALTPPMVSEASRILPQLLQARSLILDLRTVQDGDPQAMTQVAQWFLGAAAMGALVHRDERQQLPVMTNAIAAYRRDMVVLVDQRTFGLAEILATVLREHERATIIGRTTQGGFALTALAELPTGSILQMSVARYLSPRGNRLPSDGVQPDISVEQPDLDTVRAGRDVDVERALEFISDGR